MKQVASPSEINSNSSLLGRLQNRSKHGERGCEENYYANVEKYFIDRL